MMRSAAKILSVARPAANSQAAIAARASQTCAINNRSLVVHAQNHSANVQPRREDALNKFQRQSRVPDKRSNQSRKDTRMLDRCFSTERGEDQGQHSQEDDKKEQAIFDDEDDDDDGWIRPDRPLVGDQGKPETYLRQQEAAEREFNEQRLIQQTRQEQNEVLSSPTEDDEATKISETASGGTVDWLKTRRSMLLSTPNSYLDNVKKEQQQEDEQSKSAPLTPTVEGHANIIPILEHVLLTPDEIKTVLESFGGINPVCVMDDPDFRRMGGIDGSIVVTAPTYRHLSQIADQLVRQLRLRKLQQVGVVGAQQGPEGNRRDPNEHWMVIDCYNFAVHIQMETTRKHLNLEALWTGEDPVHSINTADETQVDAYLDRFPIHEEYITFTQRDKEFSSRLRDLSRNRYTAHHRQVSKIKTQRKKVVNRGYKRR